MGILIRLAPAIVAGYLITQLSACGSVEFYGGIRRSDTRTITETTTAPKTGTLDAINDWLFGNHENKKERA